VKAATARYVDTARVAADRGAAERGVAVLTTMAMRGGRKNLKRATEEKHVTLQDGQSIMQVVSLRGSNIIEVLLYQS